MLRAGCRRVVGGFASVGVGIRPGHSLPEAEFPASFVKAERGESDAGVGAVGGIVLFIEQLRHEAAKHSAGTDGADGYRMDTVDWAMQKEKWADRHIQLADATAIRLQQVAYCAPDSLGRQYPQVVTNLQVDRVYQEADTSRCVQAEQLQYAESKREQNSEQKTVRARIRSPLWGLWGIVCLLLLCFLWRQKTD